MLAFWIDGYVYVRRICEESKITENGVWSKWSPGTAKFFALLLLLYHTSAKSQGMKQLMAGGGVALIGMTLVPLLSGLFG